MRLAGQRDARHGGAGWAHSARICSLSSLLWRRRGSFL
jgi:hypothetical protein